MTGNVSLKDLAKHLRSQFGDGRVPLPLPDDLTSKISSYLDSDAAKDDHSSQRLQDELLAIQSSLDSPDQNDAFVKVLRLCRPAILGEARLAEWWALVIRPVVDGIGHKRDTIEDAKEFLLSILVYDDDEDRDGQRAALSLLFTQRLLDAYLSRARTASEAATGVSHEDEFITHQLQDILVAYGRKRPKDFFHAVNGVFVQKDHRIQSLELLSAYVQLQPPYLHLVQQTPLLGNMLRCLRNDGSSVAVELALTVLIMFMPHVTNWLTTNLAALFYTYSRVLCWNAKRSLSGAATPSEPEEINEVPTFPRPVRAEAAKQRSWQILPESPDVTTANIFHTDYFFTFLYGLFPLNFMAFIRKPKKYLRATDFDGVDDLDINQEMIRTKSDIHRRSHLLHPNFYLMDQEGELSDSRWIKNDAADIVMECLNLSTAAAVSLKDPGPPPQTKLPPIPTKAQIRKASLGQDAFSGLDDDDVTLHDGSSTPTDARHSIGGRRTTSSTAQSNAWQADSAAASTQRTSHENGSQTYSRSSRGTSPAGKPREQGPPSPTHPQMPHLNMLPSPLDVLQQVARKSEPPSPSTRAQSLSQSLSVAQFPTPPSTRMPATSNRVATLQRDNMVLRSDLNFERYLKLQHLAHIGHLQRKQIRDASAEADAQNLINTNKQLQDNLAKAQEQYNRLKKETTMSRTQSKKFEDVLATKVKAYKEEERQWQSDHDRLTRDTQRLQDDLEVLRKLLAESEQREFRLKSSAKIRDRESDAFKQTRAEVDTLKDRLAEFERDKLRLSQMEEDNEDLLAQIQTLKVQIKSKDIERDRQRRNYGVQLRELEAQLESYRDSPPSNGEAGQLPPHMQQMLNNALAASQARFDRLKQTHNALLHRYAELEMKCATMEADRDFGGTTTMSSTRSHTLASGSKSSIDFDLPITGALGYNGRGPISPPSSTGGDSRRPQAYSEPLLSVNDTMSRGPSTMSSQDSIGTAMPMQAFEQMRSFSRLDNLPRTDSLQERNLTMAGGSQGREFTNMRSPTGDHERQDFAIYNATSPLSATRSNMSTTSSQKSSQKSNEKAKVGVESKVRVYGRGGAQNINNKIKNKDKEGKPAKSGAFRGLRGL